MRLKLIVWLALCPFFVLTAQNNITIFVNEDGGNATFQRSGKKVDIGKENAFSFFSKLESATIIRQKDSLKITTGIEIAALNGASILIPCDFTNTDTLFVKIDSFDTTHKRSEFAESNNLRVSAIKKKLNGKRPKTDTIYGFTKYLPDVAGLRTKLKSNEPYFDALKIVKGLTKGDFETRRLLSEYAGYPDVLEMEELKSVYEKNLFIVNLDVFKNIEKQEVIRGQLYGGFSTAYDGAVGSSSGGNPLSSIAALDVTMYADGLAKFIVKRFKQDLNELFFQEMKEQMEKNVEIQIFFPKTYKELRLINQNVYDFSLYLTGLRERMEEDLRQIFGNANILMETDKYRLKLKDNPVLGAFLGTVFQIIQGAIEHEKAGTIIENLTFSDMYNATEDGKNIKGAMQTLQLFSMGLRADTTKDMYWIHGKDNVQKLFEGDALAAKIWLGLMYQLAIEDNGREIMFANGSLRSKINYWWEESPLFYNGRDYITMLYRKALAVQDNYVLFNKGNEQKQSTENWQNFVNCYESIVDLIEHAPKIIELFDKNAAMTQNWYQGMYIARSLPTLKAEAEARKYHAAVHHFASLFKALDMRTKFVNGMDTLGTAIIYQDANKKNPVRKYLALDELEGLYANGTKIESIKILDQTTTEDDKQGIGSKKMIPLDYGWLDKFVKYGNFAASMALAQSSDEVADILETSTLPSGSVNRKAKGVNLMVNSYLGGVYGFYSKDIRDKSDLKNGGLISAPIGFSINFGLHKKNRTLKAERWLPHNLQIFVPIFDVGTIANVRLTNDTVQVPKFTLSNIFAPGIFCNLGGWLHSPLSIGLGVQRAPNQILVGNVTKTQPNALRYSISLSWDIPMWSMKHWD